MPRQSAACDDGTWQGVTLKAIGAKDWEEITLKNMGLTYNSLGESDRAIAYFQQASAIAQESGNEATARGVPNLPPEQQLADSYQAILDKAIAIGSAIPTIGHRLFSLAMGCKRQRVRHGNTVPLRMIFGDKFHVSPARSGEFRVLGHPTPLFLSAVEGVPERSRRCS